MIGRIRNVKKLSVFYVKQYCEMSCIKMMYCDQIYEKIYNESLWNIEIGFLNYFEICYEYVENKNTHGKALAMKNDDNKDKRHLLKFVEEYANYSTIDKIPYITEIANCIDFEDEEVMNFLGGYDIEFRSHYAKTKIMCENYDKVKTIMKKYLGNNEIPIELQYQKLMKKVKENDGKLNEPITAKLNNYCIIRKLLEKFTKKDETDMKVIKFDSEQLKKIFEIYKEQYTSNSAKYRIDEFVKTINEYFPPVSDDDIKTVKKTQIRVKNENGKTMEKVMKLYEYKFVSYE